MNKSKKLKYLVIYDFYRKPYFITVYNKKELKYVKSILKDGEVYKILNTAPFIGW